MAACVDVLKCFDENVKNPVEISLIIRFGFQMEMS